MVVEFFRAAGAECWSDFDYIPEEAGRMLRDAAAVGTAKLDQIKTMLTYCVRGERFPGVQIGEGMPEAELDCPSMVIVPLAGN